MKGFLQSILQEILKKNNTWNIRRLVNDSFVPSSKRPSVLYCKLTDLRIQMRVCKDFDPTVVCYTYLHGKYLTDYPHVRFRLKPQEVYHFQIKLFYQFNSIQTILLVLISQKSIATVIGALCAIPKICIKYSKHKSSSFSSTIACRCLFSLF